MNKHLEMSAEFANYLSENGMLYALVWHLKNFKEQQYFPFREKDKRVTKLAVWKGLCQIFAARSEAEKKKSPMTTDNILEEVERITAQICPDTTRQTTSQMTVEKIQKVKKEGTAVPQQKTVAEINDELQIQAEKELQKESGNEPDSKPAKKTVPAKRQFPKK